MEFVINKSKEELYDVILSIQALIDDDKEYIEVGNMDYTVYYQNKINTEELAKLIEKLWEVYMLADNSYYKKGV